MAIAFIFGNDQHVPSFHSQKIIPKDFRTSRIVPDLEPSFLAAASPVSQDHDPFLSLTLNSPRKSSFLLVRRFDRSCETEFSPSSLPRKDLKVAGPIRAGFVYSNTALSRETRIQIRRGKECSHAFPKFLIASPSFHGGRGALPSAGGHPADLTFLAGGGC